MAGLSRVDLDRRALVGLRLPVAGRRRTRGARAPAGVRGARVDRGEEPTSPRSRTTCRSSPIARGDLDEAERLTVECEHACRANDVHSQILFRSIRAKVFARTGRFHEAKSLAWEAVALAETGDFLLAHADAVADGEEVLELAGERDAALGALEEAVALYAEKGVIVEVARARASIARISAC